MSERLLPELLSKIFLKLPTESLIQCTAVCKQWRSVITSAAFVSAHLSLSRQNPLLLRVPVTGIPNPDSVDLDLDPDHPLRLSQPTRLEIDPFPVDDDHFRVVGSVDGLILLSNEMFLSTNNMILWNPSIRKFITLPRPSFTNDSVGSYTLRFGFGFDSATGDYKLLRLVYREGENDGNDDDDEDEEGCCETEPPLGEVFSLRDMSWRKLICTNVDYYLIPHHCNERLVHDWSQCFVHGAVHWIGYERGSVRGNVDIDMGILLFDLGKEEFRKMALPEAEKLSPWDFTISLIGGMLAVFADGSLHGIRPGPEYPINIWVKRDYYADSWMKILRLDLTKLEMGVCLHLRRVCEDVLKGMDGGGDGGGCRDIQVPSKYKIKLRRHSDYFICSYTESLVLLDVLPGEDRAAVQEVFEELGETQLGQILIS